MIYKRSIKDETTKNIYSLDCDRVSLGDDLDRRVVHRANRPRTNVHFVTLPIYKNKKKNKRFVNRTKNFNVLLTLSRFRGLTR